MIAGTDWTGVATAITALCGGVAAIIGAYFAARANGNTTLADGRTSAQAATNIEAAVTTPPDKPPLGELLASGVEAVDAVHELVNGGSTPKPGGTP